MQEDGESLGSDSARSELAFPGESRVRECQSVREREREREREKCSGKLEWARSEAKQRRTRLKRMKS
jgi:hypothetical protein